jgi:alpha-tubulin suppressor-like RCC1 family protein
VPLIQAVGRWAAIAISDHHTAGLSSEGQLFTWGANHRGQLGHGDKSPGALDTPVLVNAIADVEVKYVSNLWSMGSGVACRVAVAGAGAGALWK